MVAPLCLWYKENQRILPWRENHDPYRVWVSEIMLQQTRVEAAMPYYQRFLEALPTVSALADAPEEQLMKLWEGLGYYSRVRNMQKAAQTIVTEYGGQFPQDVALLEKLPGIGDYTAGAVASIAFGQPMPAVDGNVLRVLARLCDDERDIMLPQVKKDVKKALSLVYPLAEDCSDLTQGLMELGAMVCIPGVPRCDLCPLKDLCLAKKGNREQLLPVRKAKTEKKRVARTIFLLRHGEEFALVKRAEKGVLAGMWEFPAMEGHGSLAEVDVWLKEHSISGEKHRFIDSRHVFTHLIWDMQSYLVCSENKPREFAWFSLDELLESVALPSAMKPFLKALIEGQEKGSKL
ncbi:MAG: A/G-specific adenine glycosylase [Clostridia bacterium]|nr:A/G-specific adenine glycosylase [Clostridia bacterium]